MKSLVYILLFLPALLHAQTNLVPNPGFEDFATCPALIAASVADFDNSVSSWKCPTDATSDYYNACSAGNANVPANFVGTLSAHNGKGYAGIITLWVVSRTRHHNYREYIQSTLLEPMEKDAKYCVTFYVSTVLAQDSLWKSYSHDDIGAIFTKSDVNNHSDPSLPQWSLPVAPVAHVSNTPGRVIMPAYGWVKVAGVYKASGGERYITIGSFSDPDDSKPPVYVGNSSPIGDSVAYFFVDDVSIVKFDGIEDTILCRADLPIKLHADSAASGGYLWNTGETTKAIATADTGWHWVEYDPGCIVIRDSALIKVLPPPEVLLPADTFLCTGAFIRLNAQQPRGTPASYYWNTGDITPNIVTAAGEHSVTATNRCGTATDTILVDLRELPQFDLPDKVDLCLNEQLTPVSVSSSLPSGNYLWSTGATGASVTINKPGIYWLVGYNECGRIEKYVEATGCPPQFATVYIPNAFSPNGDGNNDIWNINTDEATLHLITVYNRWGEKVFESAGEGWDGRYKGAFQPAGVYIYYIKGSDLVNTGPVQYKGSVTLIR